MGRRSQLLALSFILGVGLRPAWGQSAAPSAPAAIVNGEPIAPAEVEAVVKLLPDARDAASDSQRRQQRHDALEMLIDDTIMRQFLKAYARPVKPAEIDRQLVELVKALQSQKRTLPDFLKDTCQDEEHLRQDIVKKIQWDEWSNQQITDTRLQQYYQLNKDYYDQVTVRASHILLRVPRTAPPAEQQAARAKLQQLRALIVAGQLDFAEAAKKYSQCETAPRGGDLGYFPRKWVLDEALAQVAFQLKPGEVSDVVQSDYGLHLVKVIDRRPGEPSDFATFKEVVRRQYAEELWRRVVADQRQHAQIQRNLP